MLHIGCQSDYAQHKPGKSVSGASGHTEDSINHFCNTNISTPKTQAFELLHPQLQGSQRIHCGSCHPPKKKDTQGLKLYMSNLTQIDLQSK